MGTLINARDLLQEFHHWGITCEVENWRVKLTGGDWRACEHYQRLLLGNSDVELNLILELSKHDEDLRYAIEERAAIREADGLAGDFVSAIKASQR